MRLTSSLAGGSFFCCLCAELRSDAGSISDVWFASSFPIYLCLFVENHVKTAWHLLLFQPALLNSSFTFSAAPTMDPLFPFSPCAHGLSIPPLWHHGSHFHTPPPMYEDDNDSGYASSEQDFPHHHGMEVDESFEGLDPADDPTSWQLRGTGARHAFEIQRYRLDIFEPCSELHDAFCACDTALNHYVSGPHLKVNSMQRCPHQEPWQPRPYPNLFEPVRPSRRKDKPHKRDTSNERIPSPARISISNSTSIHLDSEDHKSRVPAALPSLGNRVESEADDSSSSSADSLASRTSERKGWKKHSSGDRVSASTRRGVREERGRLEKRVGVLKERSECCGGWRGKGGKER